MARVAVVLSGCGHLDGAEIRESVLALLYLDQMAAEVDVYAPDMPQTDVVNHVSGEGQGAPRSVIEEAARIARGNVQPLSQLVAETSSYDALVIPGGYGVAKTLSNLAFKGADGEALPDFKAVVESFFTQGKPIGAICIAPAVLALALKDAMAQSGKSLQLTIGDDEGTASAIEALGGRHVNCATEEIVVDEANRVVSCSAYMREDALSAVAQGIEKLVAQLLRWC